MGVRQGKKVLSSTIDVALADSEEFDKFIQNSVRKNHFK